jgi:hypothetical protein
MSICIIARTENKKHIKTFNIYENERLIVYPYQVKKGKKNTTKNRSKPQRNKKVKK